jgi:hypothetical protein
VYPIRWVGSPQGLIAPVERLSAVPCFKPHLCGDADFSALNRNGDCTNEQVVDALQNTPSSPIARDSTGYVEKVHKWTIAR